MPNNLSNKCNNTHHLGVLMLKVEIFVCNKTAAQKVAF